MGGVGSVKLCYSGGRFEAREDKKRVRYKALGAVNGQLFIAGVDEPDVRDAPLVVFAELAGNCHPGPGPILCSSKRSSGFFLVQATASVLEIRIRHLPRFADGSHHSDRLVATSVAFGY